MNYIYKAIRVSIDSLLVFLAGLIPDLSILLFSVLFIEGCDLVSGVWKSVVVSGRNGCPFKFESVKLWRTVVKVALIMMGVVMAHVLDAIMSGGAPSFRLAWYFLGLAGAYEAWSFLENAAVILDKDGGLFRFVRKIAKERIIEKGKIDMGAADPSNHIEEGEGEDKEKEGE